MSHDIHQPDNPGPDGQCPDCERSTNQCRFLGYFSNDNGTERAGYYECHCGNVFGVEEDEPWS